MVVDLFKFVKASVKLEVSIVNEFGVLLRKYRHRCQDVERDIPLTQERLAELLEQKAGLPGYSGVRVSNWERGREKINLDDRSLLVGLIHVLHICGGITTFEEANALLYAGNYRNLNIEETHRVNPAWLSGKKMLAFRHWESKHLEKQAQLKILLARHFDGSELEELCLELGVADNIVNVEGDGRYQQFIAYMEQNNRLEALFTILQQKKPDVLWPDLLLTLAPLQTLFRVPEPPSEENSDITYYLYISESKLNMLWPQLPPHEIELIATKLGIDAKETSSLTRVKIVSHYIENYLECGTVEKPAIYFSGILPMMSTVILHNNYAYVYFGAKTNHFQLPDEFESVMNYRAVALVGSPKHILGYSRNWGISDSFFFTNGFYSMSSIMDILTEYAFGPIESKKTSQLDLPTVRQSRRSQYVPIPSYKAGSETSQKRFIQDDTVTSLIYHINAQCHSSASFQKVKFVAKRLYQDTYSVIGTPIYVALAD